MFHRPHAWLSVLLGVIVLIAAGGSSGCARGLDTTVSNPVEIDASEYPRVFKAADQSLREMGFRMDRIDYRYGRLSTRPLLAPALFEVWKPTSTTIGQQSAGTLNDQRRIAIVTIEHAPPGWTPATQPAMTAAAAPETQPTVDAAVATTSPAIQAGEATTQASSQPSTAPAEATPLDGPGAPAIPVGSGTYLLRVEVIIEQSQRPATRLSGSTLSGSMFNTYSANPAENQARGVEAVFWRPISRDVYLEQRLLADILRRSVRVD